MSDSFGKLVRRAVRRRQVKRFFLYAIGEIALVVIGILIALQVNTYRESQKNRRDESNSLTELLSNLEDEEQKLTGILAQRRRTQRSILRMPAYLAAPADHPVDTFAYDLAQFFTFERYFPIRTAYEVAKINGLKITDRDLRSEIARYYEYDQNVAQMSLRDVETAFLNDFPAIPSDHYAIEAYGRSVRLMEPEDPAFRAAITDALRFFIPNHSGTLGQLEKFYRENQQLQQAISAELARRQ